MKNFSTQAFRSFKSFIGELTAVAAGIYVGIQEAIPTINNFGTPDPWKAAASKHDIIVSGLNSNEVVVNSIRLNIVSLYSGFDLFVADIRSQFHTLHGKQWCQYDGDSPFDALERNTPSTASTHKQKLGVHRITVLNYYRLVRNAIAHPNLEANHAVNRFFNENTDLLNEARINYQMQTAPNEFVMLNFHDIKFLARVALDLAEAIDEDFDPGDETLAKLLPLDMLTRPKSAERNRNALKGWLHCTYGVPNERGERIIATRGTHQLDG